MVAQPLPLLANLASLAAPKPAEGTRANPAPAGSFGPSAGRSAPAGFRRRRGRSAQPRLLRVLPEFRPFGPQEPDTLALLAPEAVAGALGESPSSVLVHTVEDESMRDALVSSGDTLLLEAVGMPKSGELVAMWLPDDEALVLRRVYDAGAGLVRLQSEDRSRASEWVLASGLRIKGRVVAIMRNLPAPDAELAMDVANSAEPTLESSLVEAAGR